MEENSGQKAKLVKTATCAPICGGVLIGGYPMLCAWCVKEKPHLQVPGVRYTHGICDKHKTQMLAEFAVMQSGKHGLTSEQNGASDGLQQLIPSHTTFLLERVLDLEKRPRRGDLLILIDSLVAQVRHIKEQLKKLPW